MFFSRPLLVFCFFFHVWIPSDSCFRPMIHTYQVKSTHYSHNSAPPTTRSDGYLWTTTSSCCRNARSSSSNSSACCCNTLYRPTITPVQAVLFWRRLPTLHSSSSRHPRFDIDTHEGQRRCNFRSEDVPCSGLLHEVALAFPSAGQTRARTACCLRHRDGKECRLYTHNGTKAGPTFAQGIAKSYEPSCFRWITTQAHPKSLSCSGSTPRLMGHGPGRPVKTRGRLHGHGERSSSSSGSTPHLMGSGPGPSKHMGRLMGRAERPIQSPHLMGRGPTRPIIFQRMGRGPARPINFSKVSARPGPLHFQKSRPGPTRPVTIFRSARPGPDNGPMTSPEKNGVPKKKASTPGIEPPTSYARSANYLLTTRHVRIQKLDILTNKRQEHPLSGDDASTAEAARGRVDRDKQDEARRANTTPNGGPHLELERLRFKA